VINFFSENVETPKIDKKSVKKWINDIIKIHDYKMGDISIIFCDDNFLLEYNVKYLNHNYFTDIITFNYNNAKTISGDLFISVDTVKRNSIEYNVENKIEFLRVIIHGILHLLGFNDQSNEEVLLMREQETKALSLYTFP
jgi:probable rRNA maturation factor